MRLREAMRSAAGVFWTMPEYDDAIPGVVKNAVDWASRTMLPRNSMVGIPMNVVVATGSANHGVRALADLKRTWTNCGGAQVGFDFVLQPAPTRFIDEDGVETFEPVSRATLQFSNDNLVRTIDSDGGAVAMVNWEASERNVK